MSQQDHGKLSYKPFHKLFGKSRAVVLGEGHGFSRATPGPAKDAGFSPAVDTGAAASGVRMQPRAQAEGKNGKQTSPSGAED